MAVHVRHPTRELLACDGRTAADHDQNGAFGGQDQWVPIVHGAQGRTAAGFHQHALQSAGCDDGAIKAWCARSCACAEKNCCTIG